MKEAIDNIYLVKVHDGNTIYLLRIATRQKAIEQWLKWGREWRGQHVIVTLQSML